MTTASFISIQETGMRRVVRLFALITIAAMFAWSAGTPAVAQQADIPPETVDAAVEAATDAGLSDAQSEAIRSILEQIERQPGALWSAAGAIHDELGTTGALAYARALQTDNLEARTDRRMERRQANRGRRGDRPGPADRLSQVVDLTEEQQSEVDEIHSAYRERMRDRRAEDAGRPSMETREEMRSLREEMRAEIRSVLTDEQIQEIEEQRATRRSEQEARREEAMAVRDDVLGLSADQKAQLDTIRARHREARQAAREEGERIRRPMARRAAGRAEVAAILDDDQEAVFTLYHALRGTIGVQGMGRGDGPGPRGPRGANGR